MGTVGHSPRRPDSVAKITLSDRDALELSRLLKLLAPPPPDPLIALASKFRRDENGEDPDVIGSRSILITTARKILMARQSRSQFLDESLFSEPAWDMLLALYVTEESEARHSISRLGEFSGTAPTTSLRWIAHLEKMGLVARTPHPNDHRTAFIEITDDARHALDGYFSRVVAMGFAV